MESKTTLVYPFSINGRQMCSNCEHWEFLSGTMGLCDWCQNESNRGSVPADQPQSPIILGGGHQQHTDTSTSSSQEDEIMEESPSPQSPSSSPTSSLPNALLDSSSD